MPKKIAGNFNIGELPTQTSSLGVFNKFMSEIDPEEVPVKYIAHVFVQYPDKSIVQVNADQLTFPMPTISSSNQAALEKVFSAFKDIKIIIDMTILEKDVDNMVEELLGKYC